MESYEADFEDEPTPEPGYRTYEVYQRERVGETTNLVISGGNMKILIGIRRI